VPKGDELLAAVRQAGNDLAATITGLLSAAAAADVNRQAELLVELRRLGKRLAKLSPEEDR
jgi:hypothetical protein